MNSFKKPLAEKSSPIRKEIVALMNKALSMEYGAYIQYLTHAEMLTGPNCEPLIARLRELAGDEAKHACTLRDLISNHLLAEPLMDVAPTTPAKDLSKILDVNLQDEYEAIDIYETIHEKIVENKSQLKYLHQFLEHAIRHILMEEEEHVAELSLLLS